MMIRNRLILIFLLFAVSVLSTCRKLEKIMMVTTGSVSDTTYNSASISGQIIDLGDGAVEHGHTYSKTPNAAVSGLKTAKGIPSGKGEFTSQLTDLETGTKYYAAAYISDGTRTVYGKEISFTTFSLTPPVITTTDANLVTNTAATLNGIVDANNISTTVTFDYGLTTSYVSSVLASPSPVEGSSSTNVSAKISGLVSGQTYHFRVKGSGGSGTYNGNDMTFTTTVKDLDGNIYPTVTIGSQIWMKENLKTTKYSDDSNIQNVTDNTTWISLNSGAYCDFSNNPSNSVTYGRLYNWHAVNTGKLCPSGWHVPGDADWTNLVNYLVGNGYNYDGTGSGNKIAKSLADPVLWNASTTAGAIGNTDYSSYRNKTNFSALPAGSRDFDGSFNSLGSYCTWWSSTEKDATDGWTRFLYYDGSSLTRNGAMKIYGVSVRCIRD